MESGKVKGTRVFDIGYAHTGGGNMSSVEQFTGGGTQLKPASLSIDLDSQNNVHVAPRAGYGGVCDKIARGSSRRAPATGVCSSRIRALAELLFKPIGKKHLDQRLIRDVFLVREELEFGQHVFGKPK